jgi:hypothetical protein
MNKIHIMDFLKTICVHEIMQLAKDRIIEVKWMTSKAKSSSAQKLSLSLKPKFRNLGFKYTKNPNL